MNTVFWKRVAPAAAFVALAGCTPSASEQIGLRFIAPAGWKPVQHSSGLALSVPGELLEAYDLVAGGKPARLVFFRTAFAPSTKLSELQVAMRFLLLNLPSLTIHFEGTGDVGGHPAARLEATADGDGLSLAATTLGRRADATPARTLQPTRRVWIKIPLGPDRGTLEVYFHCLEADFAALQPEFGKALVAISITG